MSWWARVQALWGGASEDATEESTDYLWDPSDARSFEALREAGHGGEPAPRPERPRRTLAATGPETSVGAVELEDLDAAVEPPLFPWLRRRPVVLGSSFVVGALLALIIGSASGAFDSGPSDADVEAAFESGFADGEAEAREAAEQSEG